ncbi:teicoplanin resistance protein VanZ [Ruminococcus difficilis]|uniref:Teicoplanin resistance protein VanZ n=1 Tax=Ruminococcus difficilis TaxID=2763069 RepID=A0A934TZL6_9FIRM|nr:teicoplanin resistance protein VanZ [Ruminococcus difficilis]MBK6088622.1 teicoplanin resistance protein VanZ [Ruminococcus difficilis]
MSDQYIDYRKAKNIRPIPLPDKERYYWDLQNIENSWTGRIDANLCNTFVMEAEQQLVNAIELFEMGYFDCAYYSLRSAVEVSTTMVYLSDLPEAEREKQLEAWKATLDFPMETQMIRQLAKSGAVFADMLTKMADFFSDAKKLNAELNKFVHKQGLQHFYMARNHPINQNKSQTTFIKTFEDYLTRCLGVVAVMRLAIDPFPILLMDEEILLRCFDSMTEPYSEDFVEKYIGQSTLNDYKKTDLFLGTYDSFIKDEKKNESVFNVMKYQYIDTTRFDVIFSQLHLLSIYDIVAVLMTFACNKIVKVYALNGVLMYHTNKETNRKSHSWSTDDFNRFGKSDKLINQKYDEAFISVFSFEDELYYAEHNEPLQQKDADMVVNYVSEQLKNHFHKMEN